MFHIAPLLPGGLHHEQDSVSFGREKKRADIAITDKHDPRSIYRLVEFKKHKLKDGKEQLKSYCNATGAPHRCLD